LECGGRRGERKDAGGGVWEKKNPEGAEKPQEERLNPSVGLIWPGKRILQVAKRLKKIKRGPSKKGAPDQSARGRQ